MADTAVPQSGAEFYWQMVTTRGLSLPFEIKSTLHEFVNRVRTTSIDVSDLDREAKVILLEMLNFFRENPAANNCVEWISILSQVEQPGISLHTIFKSLRHLAMQLREDMRLSTSLNAIECALRARES